MYLPSVNHISRSADLSGEKNHQQLPWDFLLKEEHEGDKYICIYYICTYIIYLYIFVSKLLLLKNALIYGETYTKKTKSYTVCEMDMTCYMTCYTNLELQHKQQRSWGPGPHEALRKDGVPGWTANSNLVPVRPCRYEFHNRQSGPHHIGIHCVTSLPGCNRDHQDYYIFTRESL